jgi:O-antigen ligase
MYPFFNDHTSYAAMLAMFTPFIISSLFDRSISLLKRRFISLLLFYFIVAIVLSYTRAAWLSLIVALGVFVMIYYKIKFRTLLLSLLFVVILILGTKDQVMRYIEQNNTESSSDYLDHIKSAYNINSDVSNVERINRWMAAFRMFAEKPFVGFGPGTYQFEYAPFQKQDEKTRISTNAGDRGNAHSEYIGPLAETGIIGGITFMILVIVVLYKGIRIYQNTDNQSYKLVSLSLLLGLITYFVHGTLNNFLDTDKASCPFWGFIAMLAVIDILNKNKKL